ncbi:hypothetical protein EZV73_20740 [Acidaminobacter sp. JC074]|uniref:hypothetical protein n=1 Tax=Acidaminobacter sp. JC074 TaxID=2530199 RepID=UPI001F0D6418|nr:hypothetical protein [Acidaminobacter sp. JC074]MCH4890019.1 hypothetical protein [Acidaminobacter sp. JC074]
MSSGILWLVDRFKFVFIKAGIDFDQMRRILALKLVMDTRRSNTSIQDENKNTQVMALLSYGLMGLFLLVFSLVMSDLYVKVGILMSITLVMMSLTMISDFSNVILDIREKSVLHTKPIDPKAISAAKVLHILNYMVLYTMALMLPSLVAISIKHGLYVLPLMVLAFICINFIVVFITSILYVIILKTFDGEKLKDIINFFQISLAILMMVGYQLFNNTIIVSDMNLVIVPKWYHVLMPSMWYASWFIRENTLLLLVLKILGVVVPVVLFWVYSKYLSKRFESYLSKLEESGEKINITKANHKKKRLKALAKLLTGSRQEEASFMLAMTMLSKDRKLKVMMLPTMALGACLPIILTMRMVLSGLDLSNEHLWIYMTVAMNSIYVLYLVHTEHAGGAWLYDVFPYDNYFDIHKGLLKAYLLKYVLPMLMIPLVGFVFIIGPSVLLDLLCASLLLIIIVRIAGLFIAAQAPFSLDVSEATKDKGGMFVKNMIFMTIVAVLAFLHMYLKKLDYGVTILTCLYLIINIIIWHTKIFYKSFRKEGVH